jgi:hypothetical protein
VHNSSRLIAHHLTFSCETQVNFCAFAAVVIAFEWSSGQRELQTEINERIRNRDLNLKQSGFTLRLGNSAKECRFNCFD